MELSTLVIPLKGEQPTNMSLNTLCTSSRLVSNLVLVSPSFFVVARQTRVLEYRQWRKTGTPSTDGQNSPSEATVPTFLPLVFRFEQSISMSQINSRKLKQPERQRYHVSPVRWRCFYMTTAFKQSIMRLPITPSPSPSAIFRFDSLGFPCAHGLTHSFTPSLLIPPIRITCRFLMHQHTNMYGNHPFLILRRSVGES